MKNRIARWRIGLEGEEGQVIKVAKAGRKKKSIAWGWIILCYIIIWPLGMILLSIKLSTDREAVLKDSGKAKIMSIVLMVIGVIIFLFAQALGDTTGPFGIWAIMLIGGGVWTLYTARTMKADGVCYKKCIAAVVNQGKTSIVDIALAVGITYEEAEAYLQKMIDMGYFANAHIDAAERRIVLAETNQPPLFALDDMFASQLQGRVVSCGSCGASNRVVGQIGKCEYCGSYLQ